MSLGLLLFWGAVGWCGTPWPGWWRHPPPPPPPDPWWLISRLVGIVCGVIGGWLFNQAWPVTQAGAGAGLEVVASGVAALVGAIVLLDLVSMVRGGGGAKAA
jgi:uncharacterized membrane protein YeaQ/YmgE (transglycosylase-associated protein family)